MSDIELQARVQLSGEKVYGPGEVVAHSSSSSSSTSPAAHTLYLVRAGAMLLLPKDTTQPGGRGGRGGSGGRRGGEGVRF